MRRTPMLMAGSVIAIAATTAACSGSSGGTPTSPPSSGGGGGGGGSSSSTSAAQHPKSLIGSVGKNDAYVISLTDQDGNPITNLAAGKYSLAVHDYSTIHNFHLTGSGVDDSTAVGDVTTKTFSVTFKPGQYSFVCDVHRTQMNGAFTVS